MSDRPTIDEFKFACPFCGQHLVANTALAGNFCECPGCLNQVKIPGAGVFAPRIETPKDNPDSSRRLLGNIGWAEWCWLVIPGLLGPWLCVGCALLMAVGTGGAGIILAPVVFGIGAYKIAGQVLENTERPHFCVFLLFSVLGSFSLPLVSPIVNHWLAGTMFEFPNPSSFLPIILLFALCPWLIGLLFAFLLSKED